MITADSVAATVKVTDDIAASSPTTNLAFALGPEDVKIEFVEVVGTCDGSTQKIVYKRGVAEAPRDMPMETKSQPK